MRNKKLWNDWATHNIGPTWLISLFKPHSFPCSTYRFFFGRVVGKEKVNYSLVKKAEGLWGRKSLKAWPRWYSANNSFHYKNLNCLRNCFQHSIQILLANPRDTLEYNKNPEYMAGSVLFKITLKLHLNSDRIVCGPRDGNRFKLCSPFGRNKWLRLF